MTDASLNNNQQNMTETKTASGTATQQHPPTTTSTTAMLSSYQNDRHDPTKQLQLFRTITNIVAQQHWDECDEKNETKLIQPSSYLDIEMSNDQIELFNPSLADLLRHMMGEE